MLGFLKMLLVLFILLCLAYFLISSHCHGLLFFYLLDVALLMLFLLIADDDCEIIFILCFEWKGYVKSITMSEEDVI